MDSRIPERFLKSPSKAKGVSVNRLKANKLQRQLRVPSVDTNCIQSSAIESLMLSLKMYLNSARMVSSLADECYEHDSFLLTEEDKDNLKKIYELRHHIKNEINDLDQHLQNMLNRIHQPK